jgi:hypothetical protein
LRQGITRQFPCQLFGGTSFEARSQGGGVSGWIWHEERCDDAVSRLTSLYRGEEEMIPERNFHYVEHKLRRIPDQLQRLSFRIQWMLRTRGVRSTVVACILKIHRTIHARAAARRWSKYWAREFDDEHGVKTEYFISLDDLDVRDKAEFRTDYQATNPAALHKLLNGLQISYDDFVFIDLGSGMGRAVLVASEFPFKKIIGVEFSSELHRVAEQNIRNFRNAKQRCHNIELICRDALDYPIPPEKIVFYLYNPFRGPIMQGVLENVQRSLEDSPREILITYFNPHHDLLEMAPFLEQVQSGFEANNPFAIYRNKDQSAVMAR